MRNPFMPLLGFDLLPDTEARRRLKKEAHRARGNLLFPIGNSASMQLDLVQALEGQELLHLRLNPL